MGESAARRGPSRRNHRPGPGTRKTHPSRWALGTDTSSQVRGPLARGYRTAQNIWKKRFRISGTHSTKPGLPRWFEECDPTAPWLLAGPMLQKRFFPVDFIRALKVVFRSQPSLSGGL